MGRHQFYKSQIKHHNQALKSLKRKIRYLSLLRISVFVLTSTAVYLLWSSITWVVFLIFFFIILFVFFVKKHSILKHNLKKTKLLIQLNKDEILALKGNIKPFKNGDEFSDSAHVYADDIDLFGENSFFQFLNRTGLKHGQLELVKMLKSNSTNEILEKQNAIKELAELVKFRQDFTADALMLENNDSLGNTIQALRNHHNFVPRYFKVLGPVFSLISIAVLLLFAFDILNFKQVVLWFFIGLSITGIFFRKINHLSTVTSKAQNLFRQYQKLIYAIENQNFKSKHLREQQSVLKSSTKQASQAIKVFSKHLDALEQRQNLMVGFVLSGFFLWDIQQCFKIERWLNQHSSNIKPWFDVIAYFDAQHSLGNLAFNQTDFVFPTLLNKDSFVLKCNSATHPLIPKEQAVTNSFAIQNNEFFIITGANMAGKSTFLRTVSLMIVMANLGLPVCAKTCQYAPTKLITSMRTSDSLTDESSYFFSELTRLKTIVEHLKIDSYFVVLDEILKGTNSQDKAEGSKQFIKKLAKTNSSGIVATHDLSLCALSKSLDNVQNYYFDAQIKDDELYFDYGLKKGICQNMNASFLLKKMGIV